ncbi:hypothetical protein GCM10022393_32900 [Aquimarina addita]|uniref:Uncharacterized protein n=1 Tax=Aquimarina addita TaxID=870485 RepID=A0ABP6UT80_9FLAO
MKTNNKHIDKTGFKTPTDYFDQFEEKLFDKVKGQLEISSSSLPEESKNNFKVPGNYFNDFDDKLLSRLNNEELTLSENLKNGLSVPENYFENVEKLILEKTTSSKKEHNKESKVISLFSRKRLLSVVAVAATIVIIFSVFTTPTETKSLDFNDIAVADIESYFDNDETQFSEIDIASLLDTETNLTDVFNDTDISDEVLLDYLSDEQLENEIISIEQ